jgi:UDP-glucose 4-epimerase
MEAVNVSPDRPKGTALTVAVTGPTGDIGISAVEALEREPDVERIIGMARRPFNPAAHGWTRTEYLQGDILDRDAVDALVAEADVVIHLAFIIMGSREESARVNLAGTRNVFEATVAADRPRRLVYTSSVAAYGYHSDNPMPITEADPRLTRALLLPTESRLRIRFRRDHSRFIA